jgi:tetratricopeptide (TPR) repeat protein
MPDQRTVPGGPPSPADPTRYPATDLPPDATRSAAPAAPFLSVFTIPGYEVHEEIARGGMGRVLAATDLAFGRTVAIKVVLPGADAAAAAARFVREARITGRLTHPNVPAAYRIGELPDGSPFLAMKLVRGRTLADLLAERPGVGHDLPRFVAVFEQVCQAVGYAHSQGIVHRDIKPANVMVGAFGEVQVMDWGLACEPAAGRRPPAEAGPGGAAGPDQSVAPSASAVTQAGEVMGTPAYMAPEQARGEEVDARADVFALGGLLAGILAGRAPFWGADAGSTLRQAAGGDTAEVLAALAGSGADADLLDLARRCLAADPAARPADGAAVAAATAAYRAGVEDRLRTAERERAAAEAKAAEQRKRKRVQFGLAAAVALLAAGAGGVAVWRVAETADREVEAARLAGEERARTARAEAADRARAAQAEAADRDRTARAAAAERARTTRAADAVANLLDQAEAWLAAGDADRVAPFLTQAAARAAEAGGAHAARLDRCREAVAVLRELEAVDDFRWTPVESRFPPPTQVAERWAAVFAGFGIVPGKTEAAAAAARVRASPVKPALLAALDGWLARRPAAPLRAILAAADPDPFRSEVRRLLAANAGPELRQLLDRPEWAAQPAGLVMAYAASPAIPPADEQRLLIRVAARRPNDFGLLMQLGQTYAPTSPETAADRCRWYQAAVAVRPHNPAAHTRLGGALVQAGDTDGAVASLREAVRLDPTHSPPRSHLAHALRIKGETDAALAEMREAVRLDPRVASHHINLGLLLRDKKDPKSAMAAFQEAVRLDPTFVLPHMQLGLLYAARRDFTNAAAEYKEAARLDPGFAFAHARLGEVYRKQGRHAEAVEAYQRALALQPNMPVARDGLAQSQAALRAAPPTVPTAPPPREVRR